MKDEGQNAKMRIHYYPIIFSSNTLTNSFAFPILFLNESIQ